MIMKHTTILVTVLLACALVAGAAAPVAADHDDGGTSVGDALTNDDGGMIDTVRGAASGLVDRVLYSASSLTSDAPPAEESKEDARETFNEHAEDYQKYLNDRDVHNGEVVEVEFVQGDETATMYVVSEYNETAEQYEGAEAVNETERDVDHTIRLEGMAADRAADELERFHDEFAEPGDDITTRYVSEMAAKYGGMIDEPFTGGDD